MRGWRIGKILGIDILIDPSWILIFLLLVWTNATGWFASPSGLTRFRGGLNIEAVALAVIASLLLFVSVLLHELGHSYIAQHYKIPVVSITLFIFGGVALIGDEPERPGIEFFIAIAGPIMSALLAIVTAIFWVWPLALSSLMPNWNSWLSPIRLMGEYLALSNASLALFNLLPGFPLDGGRVLRSILWATMKNLQKATQVAMYIGRGIAVALIGLGLASFLYLNLGLNGLILALVGGFVWYAAGEAYTQVEWREGLRNVSVREIMTRDFMRVPASLSLENFVAQFALSQRSETFAVENDSHVVGLMDIHRLRDFPRALWNVTTLREAMAPIDGTSRAQVGDSALVAYKMLNRTNAEDLVVFDENGAPVGLVGQEDFSRYLNLKRYK